ncbi:MAG: amino acid ABC transporter permease [Firmicutes bacterium]|nr:amino acid ABC transporter permease [Bacillota bacterium]
MEQFKIKFVNDFITDNRWKYLTDGLAATLKITVFAALIGVVLGFLVAIIRSTYDTGKNSIRNPLITMMLGILNFICKVYLTVIRGTPVVIQLMIIYFVIFASTSINKTFVAIIAFGINSGAYVAEIVRSGIMSIDKGQNEAGRSLGFNFVQTMWHIIMPQAFKNVIPALANEVIVLLKETSVAGYIGLQDLTKGGDIIRGRTYDAFMPLIAVALIYLIIVMILSALQGKLERRLNSRDR